MSEETGAESNENKEQDVKPAQGAGSTGSSEAQLPSVPDNSAHEKSHNNRILVAGILIAVLLILVFVTSGGRDGGIFSFVPSSASTVEAIDVSDNTFGYIASLPLWKESETVGTELRTGVFRKMLPGFSDSDDYAATAALCKRLLLAEIKGEKLYVIDSGNPWQIERSYTKRLVAGGETSKVNIERIDKVFKVKLGGADFYVVKIASKVVLSESKELIAKAIRCYRGDDSSLADLGLRWDNDSDQRLIGYIYKVPAVVKTDRLKELGFNISEYRKDAAELSTIMVSPGANNGIVTRMTVINGSEISSASSGGIFSFIGSAILIILAIVIGLPMLFLLIVMLTAVYFYIVALIKGELVPVEPPELPELSKQMKEDLAKKDAPINKTDTQKDSASASE